MFVINFKLDTKKILFGCIVIALLVATIIEFGLNNTNAVISKASNSYDYILTEENYVETLQKIHENIDENIGKTIQFSGYVFRMPDFKENYFVCGRNMIQNNENNIAGFLCFHTDATKLLENEWIEVTGVISKGDYNGAMPVIKIGNIKKITAPANTYITPKNNS